MTKKKENCHYELLCLLNDKEKKQEKYERMINDIEKLLGKENIEKIEEKKWKPVYKINNLKEGSYVLIYFNSKRKKIEELKKNVLKPIPEEFLNRYELLNLDDQPKNKIKLNKKDAEQN